MKALKLVIFSLVSLVSFSAAAASGAQKCRPLGPLSPTDTVDKVARCFCESGAMLMGAAFYHTDGEAYRPQDMRQWPNQSKQLVIWADLSSNFVTLAETKDLGQDGGRLLKEEHYYYNQGSDRASGAQAMVLNEIVMKVDTPADGKGFTNCNVISVTNRL